jgi:protein SCO1
MSKSPRFRLQLVFVVLAIAMVTGYLLMTGERNLTAKQSRNYERGSLANTAETGGEIGGSFALINQDNKLVTEKDFNGKSLLITFGFTYCPDVCPTKLQEMTMALDQLGKGAERVQPLFITIDPQRDTPKQLRSYVSLYHQGLQGLTGTPTQIAEVAKKFRIFYKRGEDVGDGDYMMDHTTAIFFTAPDGKVVEVFGDETDVAQMADSMRRHLGAD